MCQARGAGMNAIDWRHSGTALAKSMFSLLEHVEYRLVRSEEDFQEVGKLREASYNSREFIDSDKFPSLLDAEDHFDGRWVIGVYIDEKLVSTIRIHLVTPDNRHGPSLEYFPEVANAILDSGQSYIDPSRFASDPHMVWQYPMLPFLTLRPSAMASLYFNTDFCLSCVRADSGSFYRRSFGSEELAPARQLAHFKVPLMLLGARIPDIKHSLETRYPFFKSQHWEQRLMFAPESELGYSPLNILPSAKYANAHLFG